MQAFAVEALAGGRAFEVGRSGHGSGHRLVGFRGQVVIGRPDSGGNAFGWQDFRRVHPLRGRQPCRDLGASNSEEPDMDSNFRTAT